MSDGMMEHADAKLIPRAPTGIRSKAPINIRGRSMKTTVTAQTRILTSTPHRYYTKSSRIPNLILLKVEPYAAAQRNRCCAWGKALY
jgi:hypothetical protein